MDTVTEDLLAIGEAADWLGVDRQWLDDHDGLWEADQPAGEGIPERWSVATLRTFAQENPFPDDEEVLDLAGIGDFLGVAATTPQQWRQRGQLPAPDPSISFKDKPLWRKRHIRLWAMFPPEDQPVRWPPGTAARPRE
jgi:hypothetical protein